uniref:Uncharacterized protein n=1 Tax=Tetraodon nigroviridis TaxID=99883 RepID=H3C1L1_TETNG
MYRQVQECDRKQDYLLYSHFHSPFISIPVHHPEKQSRHECVSSREKGETGPPECRL